MPDEEFQIEIGEAVRRHIGRRSSPLNDASKAVAPYDSPDTDPIPVFISEEVMKSIERQTNSDKEREVGGVLLGGFYRNDDGSFVEVTDFIEAESARGTDVSLTFTHETWEHIHERIALRGEDIQIVGWYHSHPGLGVFMSKDDEFIHTSFFSDPWHIAIVHDPIYTNWGCFKWSDGSLERTGGFYVFSEKNQSKRVRDYVKNQLTTRQAAPRSASANADRLIRPSFVRQPSVWTAVIVMLLIQLGVGWMMARRAAAPPVSEYRTATLLLSVSDLSGAEEHLRNELSLKPGNSRAYKDLRALSRVLSTPSVVNPDFDRANLLLAAGDQFAASSKTQAKSKPVARSSKGADEFRWSDKGLSVSADYAGDDPLKTVLDDYESAAASRAARITRAKAVNAIAKTWWSRDALKWLEEEELRQIAYGKMVMPLEYSKRYKSLPAARRKIVDEVFGKK